jgi:FixJ family two-component response regulator
MDGINGIDLCREIHARGITTPVVIITTIIPANREIEGVVDFIAKPFDMYDLQRRVEKALEKGHPLDETK